MMLKKTKDPVPLDEVIDILKANKMVEVQELYRLTNHLMKDKRSNLTGRKHKRWKNLVDWAKAHLTQHGLIKYMNKNGKRYIVWLG